jgi:cytochrome P450
VLIKDGDGIVIPNDSANHDPDQFERPEELDVNRDARSHLAFGDGVHQCIGQHLCRMILEVAYPALFRRIPGLRLAQPLEGLPFEYGAVPFTVRSALVTW